MRLKDSDNRYAQLLKEQGSYVLAVDGVDWYEYNGFMIPAYLPHCCPEITPEIAARVVRISGRPFARWDSGFGEVQDSAWWYVIRKGTWSLEQCSGNTRSKIRRGRKRLHVRLITPEEVQRWGYDVCKRAATRYDKSDFVPLRDAYEKKVQAAARCGNVLQFFGVFSDDKLVGYSENYIQKNAAFWESIWYDPKFLPKYSSYVLIDGMLNYYLNEKNFSYVSDGSRSIYHKTHVQDYLMRVFGFRKEYAILKVVYSGKFKVMVSMAYPFRHIAWLLCDKRTSTLLHKVGGILRQEYIRRECMEM